MTIKLHQIGDSVLILIEKLSAPLITIILKLLLEILIVLKSPL